MKKLYFLALSIFASVSLMATQVKVAAGTDLQAAVNGASSGDTVLVQAGTYEGNFTMKDGVYVSGGWNEDFTAQTEHASILDAKQSGRVLNQPADFTTLTIWDNFTIQNGKLSAADGVKNLGAGVALMKKGRVINCLIQNNTFAYSGTCIGGGIGQDVGERNDTCAINCVVRNNVASHGGGVRIRGVILNSIIEGNTTTTNAAGGMHLQGGAAYNCIIRNNESLKDLGGVRLYGACDLVNCLIVGNKCAGKVGGLQAENASSNIINCTIVGNEQAATGSEAVFCGFRDNVNDAAKHNGKFFVNNVVYGNKVGDEVQAEQVHTYIKHYVTNGTFANNAFQGVAELGAAYIQLSAENNPQFVDSTCAIAWTSPLYNAGSNDALAYFVGDKDVYGNARKQGANMEIGAVEHTEYTATVELGEGGTLEVDYTGEKTPLVAGEISVPAGFTTKLYVTPAENYALETITLNGEALVAEEGVYTIPAVTGDITLKVEFDCDLYKVAAGEDLQLAVNKAEAGDTVLVQAGTYEGNFTMKDGVYVSGGWNEDFTAQTEHASILDAKANGRVLNQPANFTTLTIWDNFTIQNGKLKAIAADKLGAGVALMKKGRVINCLVQNNTFDYSGNCMGGGIGQETGDKNDTCAINCVVRYNTATHGGGVRIRGVILNSTIEYNESSNNGGGLYLQAGSAYNCIITNNVSLSGGGGVDMYGTGSLVNCLVANNTAGNVGGLSMRSNNRETADSGSDIINCTIVNNTQKNTNNPQFCGVRLDVRSNPNRAFVNNVVYGNTINGEVQAQELGGYPQGYGKFLNNAVAGTTANVTYIQLDAENAPQFNENYSFAWTSPLYNAGSNDALAYFVGDKDVYGNARKQGANIEIGAVEIAEPTQTIITETFDLTQEEDTRNMGGAYNIYAGDYTLRIYGYTGAGTYQDDPATEEDAAPLLFTPDYDDALNPVVVVTIDEENNKEVMEVTATSADGKKVYNLTINIALPSYEKYSLMATGIQAENDEVEGVPVIRLKGKGYLNGEEAVPFEFMVYETMMGYMAEGTIGEIYVFSTEAEFFAEEGEFLLMATMQDEEGKYLFNVEVMGTMPKAEVDIVVKETKDVTLYNLNMNVQGNMAMVTAEGETLSFWLTLLETENYYGTYTNDAFSNIWYGDDQLYAAYGDAHVYAEVDGKAKFVVSFISTPDAEGNVTLYNFTLYAGEKTATGVENLDTTIAPVKMLRDGQLVIIRNGVEFNSIGQKL